MVAGLVRPYAFRQQSLLPQLWIPPSLGGRFSRQNGLGPRFGSSHACPLLECPGGRAVRRALDRFSEFVPGRSRDKESRKGIHKPFCGTQPGTRISQCIAPDSALSERPEAAVLFFTAEPALIPSIWHEFSSPAVSEPDIAGVSVLPAVQLRAATIPAGAERCAFRESAAAVLPGSATVSFVRSNIQHAADAAIPELASTEVSVVTAVPLRSSDVSPTIQRRLQPKRRWQLQPRRGWWIQPGRRRWGRPSPIIPFFSLAGGRAAAC